MRIGVHNSKIRSTAFIKKLTAPKFHIKNLHKHTVMPYRGGCGTAAISMITGLAPRTIDRELPKTTDAWSDLQMKRFLRSHGYTVTEITVAKVTQDRVFKEMPITYRHLLLIGQEQLYGEATWAVVHQGYRYHNFSMEALSPMEFLNNPTMTVYAITHKKWNNTI